MNMKGPKARTRLRGGCTLPSLRVRVSIPRKSFEILHSNLHLVHFGVVCLGQQCQAKILEGRKDTFTTVGLFFVGRAIAPLTPIVASDLVLGLSWEKQRFNGRTSQLSSTSLI